MSGSHLNQPADTEGGHKSPPTDDALQSDQATAGSTPPVDAAASLRAAALSTRKQRRKIAQDPPHSSLPQRPIPSALVLNYGDEETTSPTTAPASAVTSTVNSKISEAQDNREEGEISDTENTPPAAKSKPSPKKALRPLVSVIDKKTAQGSTRDSAIKNSRATSRTPATNDISHSTAPSTSLSLSQSHTSHHANPPPPVLVVDADHVRPGLAMNASEYERAKDIILDLLGWGVDPEYLVETGLSREVIFYVFTELRLRLPRNLDPTGLIPVFSIAESSLVSGDSFQAHPAPNTASTRSNAAMPPPPSLPPRYEPPPVGSSRISHPSLPQKPPPPTLLGVLSETRAVQRQSRQNAPQQTRVNSPPIPSLSVRTDMRDLGPEAGGSDANLHEMEQRRKQELIARKAAVASRKNKAEVHTAGLSGSSSAIGTPPHDVHAVPDSDPASSIDAFLSSIDSPAPDSDAVPAHFRRHASPEAMEVDDIPGLSGHERPVVSRSSDDDYIYRQSTSQSAFNEPPPTSTESNNSRPSDSMDASIDSVEMVDGISGSSDFTRRGTKRPIASDFVDFEGVPPRPHTSNGYSNGPPSMRRKATNSFASVSGMRRCVIDLSDSESDGEEGSHRETVDRTQRIFSPLPSRSAGPHSANGFDRVLASNGNSGHQSPAALQEKEEEIRLMRERIEMMKQKNKQKKATATPKATLLADPQVLTDVPAAIVAVKQEDGSPTSLTTTPIDGASNGISDKGPVHDVFPEPSPMDSGSILPISDPTSAADTTPIGSLSQSLAPSPAD